MYVSWDSFLRHAIQINYHFPIVMKATLPRDIRRWYLRWGGTLKLVAILSIAELCEPHIIIKTEPFNVADYVT